MDVIAGFEDREIAAVIDPTVAAFAPLLKARKKFIKEVPMRTFKYGELDRHQLDVFYPPACATTCSADAAGAGAAKKTPVLFFVYGGGFNTGDRSISPRTFGLVYACVGAFFARRGFVVVIPDYRLVPHVAYPAPAEDIRDALRWAVAHPEALAAPAPAADDTGTGARAAQADVDRLVLMGHSAGAAHVATLLFDTRVLPADDALRAHVRAGVLESPPYDLSAMTPAWPTAPVHAAYWGTLAQAHAGGPLQLFRRLADAERAALPALLMVEGEREPDWLVDAGDLFQQEVERITGERLPRVVAKGHNHISLNWALSTGEGEEWAEEVVAWLEKLFK